jgi:hypothetical protein
MWTSPTLDPSEPFLRERRPAPVDPAPRELIVLALAAGLALDIGIRGGPSNAFVTVAIVLVVIALASHHRVEQASARILALVAIAPAVFLAINTSPATTTANLTAIAVLLGLACAYARSGSIFDTTPFAVVVRAGTAFDRSIAAPKMLRPALPATGGRATTFGLRLAKPAAIAIPMLAIVVALLAAADPVFKRLLIPKWQAGPIAGHVALLVVFACVVVAIAAAAQGDAEVTPRPGRFRALEVTVMLGLAAIVLGLFAIAQLVALSDAGDRLVAEAGITPAEYARSGFFQLCWATAFLVAFLAIVRGLAEPGSFDRGLVRVLATIVPLMAIGLVVVSVRRMALYDDAFGLTMLRLWVVVAAVWMGVVLLMIAARNAGVGRGRNWLVGGTLTAALALTLIVNVVSPEALIVRHNVARAERGETFDAAYLNGLSDDAVPAIVHAIEHSPSRAVRSTLRATFECDTGRTGVAALNRAASAANAARRRSCETLSSDS